jgi:MFS transporter, DHA2 family, methylenomycin A resistance protein
MITAANVVGGRSVARFGLRIPMFAGLVIAAAGCAMLTGIDRHTTYLAILPGPIAHPVGYRIGSPRDYDGHIGRSPVGTIRGRFRCSHAVRQTGGAVGVALFGALMATDMVRGVRIALVISGLLLLVIAVVSLIGMQVPQAQDSMPGRPAAKGKPLPSSAG